MLKSHSLSPEDDERNREYLIRRAALGEKPTQEEMRAVVECGIWKQKSCCPFFSTFGPFNLEVSPFSFIKPIKQVFDFVNRPSIMRKHKVGLLVVVFASNYCCRLIIFGPTICITISPLIVWFTAHVWTETISSKSWSSSWYTLIYCCGVKGIFELLPHEPCCILMVGNSWADTLQEHESKCQEEATHRSRTR